MHLIEQGRSKANDFPTIEAAVRERNSESYRYIVTRTFTPDSAAVGPVYLTYFFWGTHTLGDLTNPKEMRAGGTVYDTTNRSVMSMADIALGYVRSLSSEGREDLVTNMLTQYLLSNRD
jgi:hypothetical protein